MVTDEAEMKRVDEQMRKEHVAREEAAKEQREKTDQLIASLTPIEGDDRMPGVS